jgi:hypothetical protein
VVTVIAIVAISGVAPVSRAFNETSNISLTLSSLERGSGGSDHVSTLLFNTICSLNRSTAQKPLSIAAYHSN